jgi:S-sulfo-L-cysteine synthase (3-phospho-L-serine-dependent)
MLYSDVVSAIGDTPLVKLRGAYPTYQNIYAKMEMMNPYGMKDRVAKKILIEAKRSGVLKDGMPIIESSSGTMACGIALVGKFLGHDVHIVTDPRIDKITLTKLRSLGARVHVVETMTKGSWQSARLEKLSELLRQYPGAFWPRQYENPQNPEAYQELARELLHDLNSIDILVAAVGSGGSISGIALELKKFNPKLYVVAVDAVGSVIFGQPDNPHRLQSGLGNSLIPPNVNHSVIDEVHWLTDTEAFSATLLLARREQIFAGNSSGSVYAVASWLGTQCNDPVNIVAVFPDRGDRYVNTIYNDTYRAQQGVDDTLEGKVPIQINRNELARSWAFQKLK